MGFMNGGFERRALQQPQVFYKIHWYLFTHSCNRLLTTYNVTSVLSPKQIAGPSVCLKTCRVLCDSVNKLALSIRCGKLSTHSVIRQVLLAMLPQQRSQKQVLNLLLNRKYLGMFWAQCLIWNTCQIEPLPSTQDTVVVFTMWHTSPQLWIVRNH